MLDAEMNDIYWGCEAQRYGSQDRTLTIAAAAISSATAITLFSPYPAAGKALALLASALSVVHATVFNKVRVKQIASLASNYKELAIELRLLWCQVQINATDDVKRWQEYETFPRREKKIDESAFSINRKRMRSAQQQVRRARGLENESRQSEDPATTTTAAAATTGTATHT